MDEVVAYLVEELAMDGESGEYYNIPPFPPPTRCRIRNGVVSN